MYNEMTKEDWENIDLNSRELIKCFFQKTGAIVEDTHGNCPYDLLVTTKSGRRTGVEIKDRTFAHDRFGDIFAEEYKRYANKRRIEDGEIDGAIVINVFTDGVFAMANIFDPSAKIKTCYCNKTTLIKGGSRDKTYKETLSIPQRTKIRFTRTADGYDFKKI